jgi:hypothetical protein
VGSGTINYVPKWTTASGLGNSSIYVSGSNVGIGTITPGATLDVAGPNVYIGASDQLQLRGIDNGGVDYNAADGTSFNIRAIAYNNPIIFSQAAGERVRISNSGSLGIGTASPSEKLHVNGNAIITGSLAVSSSLHSAGGNTATAGTTTTILTVATGSYRAGFFDYTVSSGSNARAGTVMSVWNNSSVEFTDNSTLSIGSTSDIVMSVTLSGGSALLRSTTTTSAWTVKTTYRLI